MMNFNQSLVNSTLQGDGGTNEDATSWSPAIDFLMLVGGLCLGGVLLALVRVACEHRKHLKRDANEKIFLKDLQASCSDEEAGLVESLMQAASSGFPKAISLLLEKAPHLINATDDKNETLLMRAARFGHLDVVKLLVEKGAELERVNQDNRTALGIAARYGRYPVRKFLRKYTDKFQLPASAPSVDVETAKEEQQAKRNKAEHSSSLSGSALGFFRGDNERKANKEASSSASIESQGQNGAAPSAEMNVGLGLGL